MPKYYRRVLPVSQHNVWNSSVWNHIWITQIWWMRIQRKMLGFWDSLVCICFSLDFLQPKRLLQHQDLPWLREQPLWNGSALGQTLLSPSRFLMLCKARTGLRKEALCVKACVSCVPQDSQHRAALSWFLSVSVDFVPGELWEAMSVLEPAAVFSWECHQVPKWQCFLSRVQMLPALLGCSRVWGDRLCCLHGVPASSRFLTLQQWFKFSSAHPCTWSCWIQVPKLIFAIDPEASAQSGVISTVTPVVNAKWRHFCHRMKRFGDHDDVYAVQRMKPCCVSVVLQYGWEQGPSSLKGLEGFPFLVEVWWIWGFFASDS